MCALDPRNTLDTPGTNPNKGMNVKKFLIYVGVALVVVLLVLFFVASRPGPKDLAPKPDRRPNSSLTLPHTSDLA